jgi:hypothetical protein
MTHATDIIGYSFKASVYCPNCIIDALPTGEGEEYDGWKLAGDYARTTPVEQNLSEIAYAFGIDRMDESSFDSHDFPKVIFDSQVEESEYCETCGRDISDPDSVPTNPLVTDVYHYGNERTVTTLRYSELRERLFNDATYGATAATLGARLANVAAALTELQTTGRSDSWGWHTLTLEGF